MILATPLHIKIHRAARQLGGSVRPCAYGATCAATLKNFELKTQDDELGPYVLTDLRILDIDITTPRFINVWAGPRKVSFTPISDIVLGGLSDLGIAFPHPMYLSTGDALTLDRLVVAANSVDLSVIMGGFHTEEKVWNVLRKTFPEFRSLSTGPLGQPVGNVDGPWARKVPAAMRASLVFQSARFQSGTNTLKTVNIDTSSFYRENTGTLATTMHPLLSGNGRVVNFMERDIRELLQAERYGSPTANTEILDVMGCEL